MRLQSPPPQRVHVDPLEEAYEAAKDARNIVRDEQRRRERLQSYTGEDEITQNNVHVHVHQPAPSQPDTEPSIEVGPVKVSGLPRWAIIAIAGVVAVGTAVAASLWAHR